MLGTHVLWNKQLDISYIILQKQRSLVFYRFCKHFHRNEYVYQMQTDTVEASLATKPYESCVVWIEIYSLYKVEFTPERVWFNHWLAILK